MNSGLQLSVCLTAGLEALTTRLQALGLSGRIPPCVKNWITLDCAAAGTYRNATAGRSTARSALHIPLELSPCNNCSTRTTPMENSAAKSMGSLIKTIQRV